MRIFMKLSAVVMLTFLCGCTTSMKFGSSTIIGEEVKTGKPTFVRTVTSVKDTTISNYSLLVADEVTDKYIYDRTENTYYKLMKAYIAPFHADCFMCNDNCDVFVFDIASFGLWIPMDIVLGTLIGIGDEPSYCGPNYEDWTIKSYELTNPRPDESKTYRIPAANQAVRVSIPEFNFSKSLTTSADGLLVLNLQEIVPDEPRAATIKIALADGYGERTVQEILPVSVVAKAIDESPKRRYAFGPPNLTASVRFSEPSGNNLLDAEEQGKLILTVSNSGRGDAFGVSAELTLDKNVRGVSFDARHLIGTIPAGQNVRRELLFTAGKEIPGTDLRFTVNVSEAGGFDAEPMQVAFRSKAYEPPALVVADLGIEDQSGNAKIEPQEIIELTARVQNVGQGIARKVLVDVVPGENVLLTGDSLKRFELGTLSSGQFQDVKFSFYTNRRIGNGQPIPIRLLLSEERAEYNVAKPLDLVMNAPQKRTEEIVIVGVDAPVAPILPATGLAVDVDQNIPAGAKGGVYDVAVVIGNRTYGRNGTPNVDYAQRDAQIMREYLITTLGFDPGMILFEEDAGFAKFNEIFGNAQDHRGKLFNYVRPGESRVFVYYVGHGAPDPDTGDAYFVPVDANPQFLKTNGYRLQTFYDNLSKLQAKEITVVLDACFSGNSAKGLLLKGVSSLTMKPREVQKTSHATIITSARDDQVSAWYPEKRHSLFTYYFLKGLQGAADADRDKKITVSEIEAYLTNEVPYNAQKLRGTLQHPTISGNGAQVVAALQ